MQRGLVARASVATLPRAFTGQPLRGGPLLAQCGVARQSQYARIAPSSLLALSQNRLRHGGPTHPGRTLAARERRWNTLSGKANFKVPSRLFGGSRRTSEGDDVLQLTTFRSNGQFNTTVYSNDDRWPVHAFARHDVGEHPDRAAVSEAHCLTRHILIASADTRVAENLSHRASVTEPSSLSVRER